MSFLSDVQKPQRRNGKVIALVVLSLVVIVVAALMATGRLVWAGGGTGTLAARPVCGRDIVNKYNDAMYMVKRQDDPTPSIDETGVKQVEKSIKESKGYEDDATCQTLLFWTAMYHGEYGAAKSAHGKVKSLHDKGVFADSNIRGNQPLFSYEQLLKGISPEAKAEASAS